MSYQVNFRLFIPDCEYWEAEQIPKLRDDIKQAVEQVIALNFPPKQVGLSSAEVTFLPK